MKTTTLRPKKIDQFLPLYAEFDAIGNEVGHMQRLLRDRGFESDIYVDIQNPRTRHLTKYFRSYETSADPNNMAIYHYAVGSPIPNFLVTQPQFNVACYHNITPAEYFLAPESHQTFLACDLGRKQMGLMKFLTDVAWADSEFNAEELESHDFVAPQMILPLLRDYERLTKSPDDPGLKAALADGRTNILFVGRFLPHKCQHDLVQIFRAYQQTLNPKARLILVSDGMASYFNNVVKLAQNLGLKTSDRGASGMGDSDVVFLRQIDDAQLATAYRHAHLFFCPSEHEGFCVPLVEAMAFGLPIVANRAGAIPETCGTQTALIINKNDVPSAVGAIDAALKNPELRAELQTASLLRAKTEFSLPKLESRFDRVLNDTLAALQQRLGG